MKDHDASTGLHKEAMENYNVMMMQTSGKSMPTEENYNVMMMQTSGKSMPTEENVQIILSKKPRKLEQL